MPGNLTGGSFNVGRDLTLTLVLNGQTFKFPFLVTDIGRKALAHMHEVIPQNNDGVAVRRTTYSGYEYDLHFTRANGVIDDLVDQLQQNYYSGGQPPVISARETARNPDASVDQWQLTGGTIVPDSLGSFKGADPVNDGTLKMVFSQRNKVGGATSSVNLLNPNSYL